MCGIFGALSYGSGLKSYELENVIEVLAKESAIRGIDATGVAYVGTNNRIKIAKSPVSAYQFRFNIPHGVTAVIGHTRQKTQGSEKSNINNHPFYGAVSGKMPFALAHNGIIINDIELRAELNLPATNVETDSYVAVQMLEQLRTLSAESIRQMVEQLCGPFCFSILDVSSTLYLVRGNNPLVILHDKALKVYFYASTEQILISALVKSDIYPMLKTNFINAPGSVEFVPIREGQLLKITKDGSATFSSFAMPRDRFGILSDFGRYSEFRGIAFDDIDAEYLKYIKSAASDFGFSEQHIGDLLEEGYSLEEIEDYIYDGDPRCTNHHGTRGSVYHDLLY